MEHHPTQNVSLEVLAGALENIRVLKVHGPLTIHNFFEFQDRTREQVTEGLLIDLQDVPYMDSAALGTLVGLHVSCDRTGRKYAIVNVTERVKALFAMTRVDQFLITRDTLTEGEAFLCD